MQVGRVKHVDVQLESVTLGASVAILGACEKPHFEAKGDLCAAKCHL